MLYPVLSGRFETLYSYIKETGIPLKSGTPAVRATPKDAMKLRKTGFECPPTFVIRLAEINLDADSKESAGARHRTAKLVSE